LEGSKEGRRLYEQCGFEVVKDIEWDTRPWGGDYTDVHYVSVSELESIESNDIGHAQATQKERKLAVTLAWDQSHKNISDDNSKSLMTSLRF
jgi:hypothetical protein